MTSPVTFAALHITLEENVHLRHRPDSADGIVLDLLDHAGYFLHSLGRPFGELADPVGDDVGTASVETIPGSSLVQLNGGFKNDFEYSGV